MRVGQQASIVGGFMDMGLRLTTTASGFPRLANVYTASVSEKAGLDQKIEALSARNIRSIVADAGYTDFARIQTHAENGLFLSTPTNRCEKR